MLLRKIARPLLGAAFIASGADAVRSPGGPATPGSTPTQLPANAQTAIQVAGALQIGAGVALAAGRAPRLASVVLAGTLVPATAFASDFWNEHDPALRSMKQSAFVKNVGLLGGVLIASADTEGKPSLGWRARRKIEQVQHVAHAEESVAAALARHHDAAGTRHAIADRAEGLAHEFADRIPTDEIKSRAAQLADAARARAGEVADAAPGVLENVRHQAGDVAAEFADRAPGVAAEARDLAVKAGEETAVRARRWRKQLAS